MSTSSFGQESRGVGAAATSASVAVVATAASACCVPILAPLIVTVLGASGAAWAAGLKPYSLYFLFGSLVLLVFGFRSIYRRRLGSDGAVCSASNGRSSRLAQAVIWFALALWLVAATLNALYYFAPYFADFL